MVCCVVLVLFASDLALINNLVTYVIVEPIISVVYEITCCDDPHHVEEMLEVMEK